MSDIVNRVKEIIAEQLMVELEDITEESTFREDLNADSLDRVELIMEFEEEFGIEISDEEAQGIQTVGEAIAYIERKLQEKERSKSGEI